MDTKFNMKILFVHNSIPEYRIPWFRRMHELCEIKYVITNEKLVKKIYKYDIESKELEDMDFLILNKCVKGISQLYTLGKNIRKYDYVELPPVDSLRELWISYILTKVCRKNRVVLGYFWEKWEAPKDKQPVKRKIKNGILGTAAKFIYKRADIIFAGGNLSKKYFIDNGIDEEKIYILPNTSETPQCAISDLRNQYGIGDRRVLLYLGRIMQEKGLDYLIKAFAKLKNQDDFFLMIAGQGEYRSECERLANELHIKNLCFVGPVLPNERANYFSQCDMFIFPGTFRNGCVDVWGLTINEAIQHKKIVISTNAVGSANDLIFDGINGYLVEAENVDALCEAIEKAAKNQFLQETTFTKDLELGKLYSYDSMAGVYLKTVKKQLNDRGNI